MTYLLRMKEDLGVIAAVTPQMVEWCSEHRTSTIHVKAGNPRRATGWLVAKRRNVRGRGSSREGQSAENMQAVEGKVSCKRFPKYTSTRSVWRFAIVLPF